MLEERCLKKVQIIGEFEPFDVTRNELKKLALLCQRAKSCVFYVLEFYEIHSRLPRRLRLMARV